MKFFKYKRNYVNYDYSNSYLENYFDIKEFKKLSSNVFGSYGQDMYELRRNDYLTDYSEKFKMHYNKFKPVLDDIKGFDKTSLADSKGELVHDSIEIYKNSYNISRELRKEYFKRNNVEPNFPDIPRIEEYSSMLSKIRKDIPKSNLDHFSDYLNYLDTLNDKEKNIHIINDTLLKSKPFKRLTSDYSGTYDKAVSIDYDNIISEKLQIIKHIRESKDLIDNIFVNLDLKELELLEFYIKHHETFTLLTLEPYMLPVLGSAIFLEILTPLHHPGSFKILMNDIISRRKLALNPFNTELDKYNIYLNKSYNLYNNLNKYSNIYIVSLSFITLFKPYIINLINSNSINNITAGSAISKFLLSGEGYSDNSIINTSIDHSNKLAFTVGKAIGGISKSFLQGIASNHEDVILSSSKSVDDYLTKKANK